MQKKIVIVTVLFLIFFTGCKSNDNTMSYSKEEIVAMVMPDKEETLIEEEIIINDGLSYYHGINEDNLPYYNQILQKLDEVVGKGKYQITSIFETRTGSSIKYVSYVMHIISDDLLEEYLDWTGTSGLPNPDDPMNPFRIVISLDGQGSDSGVVKGNYQSVLMGYRWIQDIKRDFTAHYPDYYMNVDAVRMFDYDVYLSLDFDGTWEQAYQQVSGGNSINIFVPHNHSSEDIAAFVENNQDFFKKHYVSEIVIVILNEEDSYEEIQATERLYLNSYRYHTESFQDILIYIVK